MPRKRRITLGHAVPRPEGPQRVAWFEKELDELLRQLRKVASQYLTGPDPLGVRDAVKSIIGRSRITLADARARPEIVHALWNARMLGYLYGTTYFRHNWGTALIAAKRQREGSSSGAATSRRLRAEKAHDRTEQVLREASRAQRRLRDRPMTQRSLSRAVTLRLNQNDPPPQPPYTMETVRRILREEHFFRE